MEASALGQVTWKHLSDDSDEQFTGSRSQVSRWRFAEVIESEVTAMYGGGTNLEVDNEERSSLLEKYRQTKLSVSWEEFEKEKAHRDAENQLAGAMVVSTQSGSGALIGDIDMTEDLNWAASAGAA